MPRYACAHCGLPVVAAKDAAGKPVYCCYGCFLVSRIVGRKDGQGARAWDLLRLGVGALLAMNVMMISLLLYTKAVEASAVPVFRWVMLGLAAPAMAVLAYPFMLGAVAEVRRGVASLDTLIALGSLAAFGVSAANTVRGKGYVYFDTATMLPALVTFGRLLEATAKGRAQGLIHRLETLLPEKVTRLDGDALREIPLAELRAGDRLQVRPGERFPADGRIVEGHTLVDEAALTGESRPRDCGPGDEVIAGTVNGAGRVVVEAVRVGEDLLLSRIIERVEQARLEPSRHERLAERLAAALVPAVLIVAAVAGLCWLLADGPRQAGFVVLAILAVTCPCAMGIATPLATALAIARAARAGVLVRNGDALERIGDVRTVFFDKTGTVTCGDLRIQEITPLGAGVTERDVLSHLAALESGSEHAVARAVTAEAKARGLAPEPAREVEILPGQGLRGKVGLDGQVRDLVAGTAEFLRAAGIACEGSGALSFRLLTPSNSHADTAKGSGAEHIELLTPTTVVCVAWDGQVRGRVALTDVPRADAAEAMGQLREAGVTTVLLSGDGAECARAVAAAIGIDQVEAPRRPEEKIALVRAAASGRHPVAMVGDGINDAPALATADVGIAMAAGTDLAKQAGDVVLLADRLTQVPWLIALSRRTRRIIRQNLAWAVGYNLVALTAAALGWLHPLLAAVAMLVSSLTVLGNSLRLQKGEGRRDGGTEGRRGGQQMS